MITLSNVDLELMRKSGRILAETLEYIEDFIEPGLSTLDVSNKAEEIIRSHEGATPAFLGYKGFTGAACVSVNDQVVHGVPTDLLIKDGDIVSVDCGVIYEKHFSDACRTVLVGEVSPRTRKLVKITKQSLDLGIEAAVLGNRVSDISYAVQKHVERKGFKVSLEFVGHGIGLVLHGEPQVPNYGPPGRGPVLEEGMCLAIEPVVFDGATKCWLGSDKWTVYSEDGNLSSHQEDTIIITKTGPEIVTRL